MALSILDGNQSATTLSTILSSGQHITAHTVVSLGTQAITDMRGAVSGSVVSISNLPATQPVSIASVTIGNTVTIAGTVTANPTGTQTIAGTVTANIGDAISLVGGGYSTLTDLLANETIAVRELPAISGTVTANGGDFASIVGDSMPAKAVAIGFYSGDEGGIAQVDDSTRRLPISGTVTIGSALPAGTNRIGVVTIGGGTVTIGAGTAQIGSVTVGNSVTIGSLPAISGTVTANSSNGSLTTRFGSVTTANTAFATSAVTNSNRKYLLIQNITTASNVITVGVGFTPTTTQGIQLAAGAGLTFEGSYIPTGAVNLLSSVTASCFTILEA